MNNIIEENIFPKKFTSNNLHSQRPDIYYQAVYKDITFNQENDYNYVIKYDLKQFII